MMSETGINRKIEEINNKFSIYYVYHHYTISCDSCRAKLFEFDLDPQRLTSFMLLNAHIELPFITKFEDLTDDL